MNIKNLLSQFKGRNLESVVRLLHVAERPIAKGETIELTIAGVINRGELANDGEEVPEVAPDTLRTGCALDDTFIVGGEEYDSLKTLPCNPPVEAEEAVTK
jgi:hypothetical protein